MKSKAIATLLEKPMNRKEFLQHAGVGALMIFGGGLVSKALLGGQRKTTTVGYGSSPYGGTTSPRV